MPSIKLKLEGWEDKPEIGFDFDSLGDQIILDVPYSEEAKIGKR